MNCQHELLVSEGDRLSDERGLGSIVQRPLGGMDIVLLARFGDLGLGRGVGRHDQRGLELDRGHMGRSVRDG